jgi:hypothetical protein
LFYDDDDDDDDDDYNDGGMTGSDLYESMGVILYGI